MPALQKPDDSWVDPQESKMQIWSEDTVNHWRSHYDEAASHWGKWADQIAEQQVKINQGLLMAAV
jgi:hypothetical protein